MPAPPNSPSRFPPSAEPAADTAASVKPPYDLSVVIGRFQPPHLAHIAMIEQALRLAQNCVVVLGSAYHARNSKNPFSHDERAGLLQRCFTAQQWARMHVVALRDYYDCDLWVAQVRAATAAWAGRNMCLVGHLKDASSNYLRAFPDFALELMPNIAAINASDIRQQLYRLTLANAQPRSQHAPWQTILSAVPTALHGALKEFITSAVGQQMAEEWAVLNAERQAWASAPYPVIFVALDALVYWQAHILLIQRGRAPGKGLWALPGGFLEPHETLLAGALRELQEETQLALDDAQSCLRGHQVFDAPERSLRGRVISHGYAFDLSALPQWRSAAAAPPVRGGDDAVIARWWPVSALPQIEDHMHDDHYSMIQRLLRCIAIQPALEH